MNMVLFYQEEYNSARGNKHMEKFSPKKADKEVTTIRIPKDVLELIDKKATAYNVSRNEFINQCILYALSNLNEGTKA